MAWMIIFVCLHGSKRPKVLLLIMPQSFAVDFALLLEINDRMLGQLIHILAMFVDHFLGFWPFARDKTNVAASGADSFCHSAAQLASWMSDWIGLTHVPDVVLRRPPPVFLCGHAKCIFQLLTRAASQHCKIKWVYEFLRMDNLSILQCADIFMYVKVYCKIKNSFCKLPLLIFIVVNSY